MGYTLKNPPVNENIEQNKPGTKKGPILKTRNIKIKTFCLLPWVIKMPWNAYLMFKT